MEAYLQHLVLFADGNISDIDPSIIRKLRMIEIPYGENVMALQNTLKEKNPSIVVIIRMELGPDSSEKILGLQEMALKLFISLLTSMGLKMLKNHFS